MKDLIDLVDPRIQSQNLHRRFVLYSFPDIHHLNNYRTCPFTRGGWVQKEINVHSLLVTSRDKNKT